MKSQRKAGVILSYFSIAAQLLISLVYTPIMVRLLGQSEFGLYSLVSGFIGYLGLFNFGFTGSYLKFRSEYKSKNDHIGEAKLNGLFLIILTTLGIVALVCGLILAQFTPQIFGNNLSITELQKAKILMILLAINLALTFPTSVFDSIISAHEHFVFQRIINLASIIFNPLICLPALIAGYDSVAIVVITTIITALKLFISLYYCRSRLKTSFIFKHPNLKLLKRLFTFSIFIFINIIIDQINWSLDKLILGHTSGTNEVAIYSAGATINTAVVSLSSIIASVFAPKVNAIVASKETSANQKLSALLVKVGRIQFILVLFVTLGFILAGRPFIKLWIGDEYTNAFWVALFLILPLAIILPHSLGIEIRRAKNKHQKASIILLITAIINGIISIPLAIYFGAPGAALGTLIGCIINMLWLDWYYVKDIHLDIKSLYQNLGKLFICILPSIPFVFVGYLYKSLNISIICGIIYTLVYFGVIYKFGLNQEEKRIIATLLPGHKTKKGKYDINQ